MGTPTTGVPAARRIFALDLAAPITALATVTSAASRTDVEAVAATLPGQAAAITKVGRPSSSATARISPERRISRYQFPIDLRSRLAIRVLIADDHEEFRRSFRRLLNAPGGFDVVGRRRTGFRLWLRPIVSSRISS